MKKLNNKGFSLVELIIVIAIMVVLVGVLAPQFIKYVESSKQSTDIQNCAEIRAAVEAYVAENAPSSDITVTVNNAEIKISGGGIDTIPAGGTKTPLQEVGLDATIKCKSTGWAASATFVQVAKYDHSNFKWDASTDVANSNKPNKKINEAFK